MHNKNFVSNSDKNIYSIQGLPEEIIAVIFAYVSRSPKSFRENLHKVTEEKAKDFHKKWVLNYGHASVAEHAVIHLGIEKVSRFFSGILERSNPYLSFTEYSQRYQKPKRSDYYTPPAIQKNQELLDEYTKYQEQLYNAYQELLNICTQDSTEKEAFEDARYVLSLATHTNLGMTANARALGDSIRVLLSSPYPEIQDNAKQIIQESQHIAPTLMKYLYKSDFLESLKLSQDPQFPKDSKNPQNSTSTISAFKAYETENEAFQRLKRFFKESSFQELMKKFTSTEQIPDFFSEIRYSFDLCISEACYHQFLRHRRIRIYEDAPNVCYGFVCPQRISANAQAYEIFLKSVRLAENTFWKFYDVDARLTPYVVTNAHKRFLYCALDLKELYHLVLLRSKANTQWEFRELVYELLDRVQEVHPIFLKPLKN